MEIRKPAKTVPVSTVQAIAMWGYSKIKEHRPVGGQMSYNYDPIGKYKNVLVQVLDKGITVRVHFYNKFEDDTPADSAMVVFSKKAY